MSSRIGSLFSGFGGLDLGVMDVIGGSVAWHVEFDDAPSRILAHHWPDVPNYGDITKVDWSAVEPVDVLTGGFPCQDVSLAGARAGLREGTRSGLWSYFAAAIDALRPDLVVIENVRGLLSAEADRNMEPDTGFVGDGQARPVLRALGAVLGDLASLGYDAQWCGVRAADAGAPHGRFRVFILAHPSRKSWRIGDGNDVRAGGGTRRHETNSGRSAFADTSSDGRQRAGSTRQRRDGLANNSAGAPTPHPSRDESERWGVGGDVGSPTSGDKGSSEERQRLRDTTGDSRTTTPHTDNPGRGEYGGAVTVRSEQSAPQHSRDDVDWGPYRPAIERWESVTGRRAPAPTNPDGRDGGHRLSARFVEWMMGCGDGHVTAPKIGLTRNQQLKALGNGVVRQQAALAISMLLNRERVAA